MSSEKPLDAPPSHYLSSRLGGSQPLWDSLMTFVSSSCSEAVPNWKYYGVKYGWQLKWEYKKKAILYMIPHEGSFGAAMALKEPALSRLPHSSLPASLVAQILEGRMLPEGKAARVEVTGTEHVEQVKALLLLKMGK